MIGSVRQLTTRLLLRAAEIVAVPAAEGDDRPNPRDRIAERIQWHRRTRMLAFWALMDDRTKLQALAEMRRLDPQAWEDVFGGRI